MRSNQHRAARRLLSDRSSSRSAARSRASRPFGLESLEDRLLLSVNFHPLFQVTNPAAGLAPLASSSPNGYTPAQVRQAYGVNQIQFSGGVVGDGSGQTIAIVDAYDDPTIQADLDAFSTQFGLPTTSSGQFTFTKVNQTGGSTLPATNASWAVEESLDVEWVHAIAPKANIVLVESNDNSGDSIFGAVAYAATIPGVSVVSMSFGGDEFSDETSLDASYFTTPAGHAPVSFIASSGDSGAPPEYPSSSPNVLAVGGTALFLDSSNNYLSESGWGGGGGGVSVYETQPPYQNGIVTQGTTQRTTPDVAYDASPSTGFPVYDSFSYGAATPWQQVGGTSAGAPQWSALVSIANQGRVLQGSQPFDGANQLLPAVYSLPASDFHDVTSGTSNGNPHYTATAGYDLVTGLGSPVANLLVPDLANYGASSPVATTTTLSSSTAPSVYGQSVTFTATVQASGTATPTGSVTFLDGSTVLGTVQLNGGSATFSTAALATGSHSLTASYGGSASAFQVSISNTLTRAVNPDATTTTVISSANPSTFGQSVTFTTSVSANAPGSGTPSGMVTFLDGTTTLGTATLSNGSASFSTSALSVGSHAITVQYAGDTNFAAGLSAGLTQVANQALLATTTTLRASVNPSLYMQRVTFTATVKPTTGKGTPTGTVTFLDGNTVLGSATLGTGTAAFTVQTLSLGNHSITASYSSDATYAASTSLAVAQTVNADPTSTVLVTSSNPSIYGQNITFTATVKPGAPGSGTPTGTVTWFDGGTALTTVALSNGRATYTTNALALGGHAISVAYGGDGNYLASNSATSSQQVNQDVTTAKVTSSLNPAAFGRSVTFTTTIRASSPGSGTPTGSVSFLDGGILLGTGTLSGGIATFTTTMLASGNHTITVSYAGDANFKTSTSSALTQTIKSGETPSASLLLKGATASETESHGLVEVALSNGETFAPLNPGASTGSALAPAADAKSVRFGLLASRWELSRITTLDRLFAEFGNTASPTRSDAVAAT
jgi:subtilase family serine protease